MPLENDPLCNKECDPLLHYAEYLDNQQRSCRPAWWKWKKWVWWWTRYGTIVDLEFPFFAKNLSYLKNDHKSTFVLFYLLLFLSRFIFQLSNFSPRIMVIRFRAIYWYCIKKSPFYTINSKKQRFIFPYIWIIFQCRPLSPILLNPALPLSIRTILVLR